MFVSKIWGDSCADPDERTAGGSEQEKREYLNRKRLLRTLLLTGERDILAHFTSSSPQANGGKNDISIALPGYERLVVDSTISMLLCSRNTRSYL
jgi:hypothetical protein